MTIDLKSRVHLWKTFFSLDLQLPGTSPLSRLLALRLTEWREGEGGSLAICHEKRLGFFLWVEGSQTRFIKHSENTEKIKSTSEAGKET